VYNLPVSSKEFLVSVMQRCRSIVACIPSPISFTTQFGNSRYSAWQRRWLSIVLIRTVKELYNTCKNLQYLLTNISLRHPVIVSFIKASHFTSCIV